MPIHIFWDDKEKTILRADFEDMWTWQEYHSALETGEKMIEGISYPIFSIVDMTKTDFIPILTSLGNIKHGRTRDPDNLKLTIIVDAPADAKLFMNIVDGLNAGQFSERFAVETLQEAYQLIEKFNGNNSTGHDNL